MTYQSEYTEQQLIIHVVEAIEAIRAKRKRHFQRHPQGKRFSQDELSNVAYPSYKNLLLGRTQRIPDRGALLEIADYLECTPTERNVLLRAAKYASEDVPDAQWRKQVTILVASIFAPVNPTLDLEDVAEVMRTLWNRIEAIIVSHRGMVAEHSGNILLALWSVEITYEDDPERAVRAALAIQAELQSFRAKSQIGIHIGPVLLQTGQNGHIQVSGETLNIASLLCQIGSQDSTLISQSIYATLHGILDVTTFAANLPFVVFKMVGLKSIAGPILLRGIQEVETSLIGRKEEFSLLQNSFYGVIKSREAQLITIVAEAGIGKSRLLLEFDNWLHHDKQNALLFKGRASQSSQEIPYSLLRSVLSFRFQISDDDFSPNACQKIEEGIGEFIQDAESAQKAAHIISHLLSFNLGDSAHVRDALSDAQEFFEIALAHLVNYFREAAEQFTVVLLLEDLHWADESSITIFQRLCKELATSPILILCTARSGSADRFSYLESEQLPHAVINLQPLSQQGSYQLLDELLDNGRPVPEILRDRIVTSSSGNPLFIEEIVKMLVENGTLAQGTENWNPSNEQLYTLHVPTTLTGLLQARFDNLSRAQQLFLQVASVFGRVFWDGSVKTLWNSVAEESDNVPLAGLIEELCNQKLIFRQRKSTFRGFAEFSFKHVLLSEVIYETILKQDRLRYHAAAANWLTSVASRNERLDEYAGLIAYHFKRANIVDEASNWYQRAGKAAAARFANNEALAYLTYSLELLPIMNQAERYSLLAIRERVYDALGMRNEQGTDLSMMFELTKSLEDIYLQVEVIVRQTNHAYLVGNSIGVAQLAKEAIRLAQSIGAHRYEASSYVMLGNVLWDKGDESTARECYENALHLTYETDSNEV